MSVGWLVARSGRSAISSIRAGSYTFSFYRSTFINTFFCSCLFPFMCGRTQTWTFDIPEIIEVCNCTTLVKILYQKKNLRKNDTLPFAIKVSDHFKNGRPRQ